MNNSLINSSVTLRGLQQKLDVIANNVANVNTLGFKRKQASFVDVLASFQQQPPGFQKEGRLTPLGLTQGWGAKLGLVQTDFSQGTLKSTDNPLDLAIEGDALFEVEVPVPDGNGTLVNEVRWTRDGAFSLSVNPDNPDSAYLTTKDGYFVRGTDDQPIQIPANHKIRVEPNGTVFAYDEQHPETAPVQVGQLKLMRAVRPQLLEQAGDNLYKLPDNLQANVDQVLLAVDENAVNAEDRVAVRQGFLEQSNVNLADEMSELLLVQRAYQLNSRAIQSSDAMMNMANNLRG